tara:strand:- start:296 stop:616 length:321 start_codon:yes stop_codon:yes gene_type:complete
MFKINRNSPRNYEVHSTVLEELGEDSLIHTAKGEYAERDAKEFAANFDFSEDAMIELAETREADAIERERIDRKHMRDLQSMVMNVVLLGEKEQMRRHGAFDRNPH